MSTKVDRLPGMRDVSGDSYARLRNIADALTALLRDHGYGPLDTPLLEDTELFVRKSGGELTSRLYTFVDPGGNRVSLRPEFTSSVIRHFVQEGGMLDGPVRWQYHGPVFRYEHGANGGHRQSTQVGAELIGASGADADAEVLSLAWEGLATIGLDGHRMRVGHVGVLMDVVRSYGLSESTSLFIIRNVPDLKCGAVDAAGLVQRAQDVGLLGARPGMTVADDLSSDGQRSAREYIQVVLAGTASSPMGRRSPEQIVDRLMRKVAQADSTESFQDAASLMAELVKDEGSPETVLDAVRRTAAGRMGVGSALADLERLCDGLVQRGIDESRLVLDLGLVREIAYYTGVIFEIGGPSQPSLCGGGRYDGLIRAMGGDNTPALGFAYTVENLVEATA